MPAKKDKKESPETQSERFRKAVRDLVDAGELNPTEADEKLEQMLVREPRSSQLWKRLD